MYGEINLKVKQSRGMSSHDFPVPIYEAAISQATGQKNKTKDHNQISHK